MLLKGENHLMDGRRRHAKVSLNVSFCWSAAIQLRIIVDERKILTLLLCIGETQRSISFGVLFEKGGSHGPEYALNLSQHKAFSDFLCRVFPRVCATMNAQASKPLEDSLPAFGHSRCAIPIPDDCDCVEEFHVDSDFLPKNPR